MSLYSTKNIVNTAKKRKCRKMNELTEKTMREAFKETTADIQESPILQSLFSKGIENFSKCKDLAGLNLESKLYYAMVLGYSFQNILQKQFISDVKKDCLHQVRDGYEITYGEEKQVILTHKGAEFESDKQIIELARENLGIEIPDTAKVRKLTEIEVARCKKDVLNEMNKKGN